MKLKERFRVEKRKTFLVLGGKILAQIAQRGSRCLLLGTVPGQIRWGSDQPPLVADVLADFMVAGLNDP